MRKSIIILVFLLLFINTTLTADSLSKGNKHYLNDEYGLAYSEYLKAIEDDNENPYNYLNTANVLYRLKEFDKTLEYYQKAIEKIETNKKIRNKNQIKAKAFFNIGNTYFQKGDLNKALEMYKNSLILNPLDKDVKYNWYLVKKLLEQRSSQKKQSNDKNQNETNKNQNDKKNNSNNQNNDNDNQNNSGENQNDNQNNNNNRNDDNESESDTKTPSDLTEKERELFLNNMNNKEIKNRKNHKTNSSIKTNKTVKSYEKDW